MIIKAEDHEKEDEMFKFRIKIPQQFDTTPEFIGQYAKRISRIISFYGELFVSDPKDEFKWSLGTFNDWQLELIGERTFELRHRYGIDQKIMLAIKRTLMYLLHFEDGDDKPKEIIDG